MPTLRYLGSAPWTQVITDDDGKFKKIEVVQPGETVSFDDEVANRFLLGPRHLRLFVKENGPEDPQGSQYEASRWEAVQGNATPYPELDMGSTVVGRRTITRTEQDNPEGFDIAGPNEGPASDNEEQQLLNDARAEGEKAYRSAKEKALKERAGGRSRQDEGRGERGAPASNNPQPNPAPRS